MTGRRVLVWLVAVAGMGLGVAAFLAGEGQVRVNAAEGSGPGIVEGERVYRLPDGRFLEVRVLVDSAVTTRDAALDGMAEDLPVAGTGEVSAMYGLWRKWAPADGPVPVSYNDEWDYSNPSARGAMQWAFGVWNGVPNSSFRFSDAGLTDAYASSSLCSLQIEDAVNSVRYSYLLDYGTLGVTCAVIDYTSVSGVLRVVEFDIQLDGYYSSWSTGVTTPATKYDVQSVMLHELGHALGLDHTTAPGAVMWPTIGMGQQVRTPTADDIAGVQALYGVQAPTPTKTATPTATKTTGSGPTATKTPTLANKKKVVAPAVARDSSGNGQPQPTATKTPTPTSTPTPTATLPPSFITFGAGTWLVGSDIPAGTYRTRSNRPACYWERLSGLGGTFGEIIANSFSNYSQVVTIQPTDVAFETDSDCGTWTSDLSRITAGPTAGFGDGVFIVGTDLAPGIWRAPGGSSCYWARLRGFSGKLADIISNDFDTTLPTVQVSGSDKGFESSNCGAWTKIG